MVDNVFLCEKFVNTEEILDNFEFFKKSMRRLEESKLDEFYFTAKSILNDYKSTMKFIAKINHLLNVNIA